MENLNAEQIIEEIDSKIKFAKFANTNAVILSPKAAQFCLVHAQYYEQKIKELTEENEKLQRLCELREKDLNDTADLLYKAEEENERLKNELEGLRGIMISYIKVFGGESASRVPIGKKLYFTLDENFSDILEERVCECTVTAVGRKGFWVSSYVPPQDDAGEFSAFDEIGKTVFFTHEDALRQLKGEEKNERQST